MASTIRVGHAGSTKSGVYIKNDYNVADLQATVLLRPKDPIIAELSARICEAGCANDNIQYDQGRRETLRKAAEAVNYDLSKITESCWTDCSAFMALCAKGAGAKINLSSSPSCGNIRSRLTQYGAYEELTGDILKDASDLRRGDILVREFYLNGSRHTVMVLGQGSNIPTRLVDDILKITLEIDNITNNKATATAKITRLESGVEKELDDSIDLSSYTWKYQIYDVNSSSNSAKLESIKINSGATKFYLNNIKQGTSYILKVIATEANGTASYVSPNVLFRTMTKDSSNSDKYDFGETSVANFSKVHKIYLKTDYGLNRATLYNNIQ